MFDKIVEERRAILKNHCCRNLCGKDCRQSSPPPGCSTAGCSNQCRSSITRSFARQRWIASYSSRSNNDPTERYFADTHRAVVCQKRPIENLRLSNYLGISFFTISSYVDTPSKWHQERYSLLKTLGPSGSNDPQERITRQIWHSTSQKGFILHSH